MKKSIKFIIVLLCILVFTILAFCISKDNLIIDQKIYKFISSFRGDYLTSFFRIITDLGYYYLVLIGSIIMIVLVCFKKIKMSFFVGLNLLITVCLNLGLKNIFRRVRPSELVLSKARGYSFPSGHTMVSVAFYGFLIYLIYRNVKNKYVKLISIILLSILILLICISRVYLGVHFASDVLAGMMLSICELIIFISCVKKYL